MLLYLFIRVKEWVSKYYHVIVDYYINTIYDMQNEKDCLEVYNEFECIQDFEIVFRKSDDAILVFDVLDNNVCSYEIDYYKLFI